jgi:hypothetical protein
MNQSINQLWVEVYPNMWGVKNIFQGQALLLSIDIANDPDDTFTNWPDLGSSNAI